jgi:hypothetical protein
MRISHTHKGPPRSKPLATRDLQETFQMNNHSLGQSSLEQLVVMVCWLICLLSI